MMQMPPMRPVPGQSRVLYYFVALILCGPWLLLLDHYTGGSKFLFGNRWMMALTVGVTMVLAATCLRPTIGRARGGEHLGGAFFLLLLFLVGFSVSLLALAAASHVIAGTPWGDATVGPAFSLLGSAYFVLYTAAVFTVIRWYAVLPLVAASYALLTWAGTRAASHAPAKPVARMD